MRLNFGTILPGGIQMKKTFVETIEVFALATFIKLVMCLVAGAGLWGTVYALWDIITWIGIVLLLDDFFFKLNRYRKLLVWEYFVGAGFAILAICGFTVARYADTCLLTYLGLGVTVAGLAAFIAWDAKIYNIATLSEDELKELEFKCWFKNHRKEDAEKMKAALYEFLRFKFANDRIEDGVDCSRLLDPDSASTVAELLESGVASQNEIDEIRTYINTAVDAYIERRK
jgi:hypothetical protein